jgi:hypothetical protein
MSAEPLTPEAALRERDREWTRRLTPLLDEVHALRASLDPESPEAVEAWAAALAATMEVPPNWMVATDSDPDRAQVAYRYAAAALLRARAAAERP